MKFSYMLAFIGAFFLLCAALERWHEWRVSGHWEIDPPRVYETIKVRDEWFVRMGTELNGGIYWSSFDLGPYKNEEEANVYRDISANGVHRTWVGPRRP